MKKLIMVVIIFVVITFFVIDQKLLTKEDINQVSFNMEDEKRSVFISYIELSEYIKEKDINTSKNNIKMMLDKLKDANFNMIILHVRPFSDAIYKSDIYPYSSYVSSEEGLDPGYDVLDFFIKESHQRNIELHAWINPYRIRNTTDISTISEKNPAYKYLNTGHVKVIDDVGIYYNPASEEVRQLIISGVEELVNNYDIDGVHFDDYFYPCDTVDLEDYQVYLNNGGLLSLSDYRLNNISLLVKGVYDAIKAINKNVLFGISPEGNINNNYDNNYVDTKKFLSEEGYVDYIMPQIYFGFFNEVMPFMETVSMWNSLIKVNGIKIIPALAFYKVGKTDNFAKSGNNEWIENDNIIKKQVIISRGLSNYGGFSIFRYSYMFNDDYKQDNSQLDKELTSLLNIIN